MLPDIDFDALVSDVLSAMRGILDHAGTAMEQWWAPGPDVTLTDAVKDELAGAAEDLGAGGDFEDWVARRDKQLLAVLSLQSQAEYARPMFTSEGK